MPAATLTGYEALSRPFRYVLEYYPAEQPELAALIGKPYTVRLPMPDGSTRPLNGIVFRAEQGPSTVRSARYTLELRPWFLRLDQERTCAVFQNMSVPEIVTKVCTDAGFGHIRNALSSTYPAKEYTVRYGETSFAFLSRLMAEAGIVYFFEHSGSAHTLVMADSPTFSRIARRVRRWNGFPTRRTRRVGRPRNPLRMFLSFRCHGRLLRLLASWMTITR